MSRWTTVRRRVGCAVLLALLPAVPVGAQGQVSDPEQRPTLLIGPVEVRPRLVLSNVGIDSNVFHESDNPRSDFTATFSPDVELMLRPGPVRLTIQSGSDFVYFHRYATERSTNARFGGRADFDFPLVKPFVAYSAAHTSARSGSEIDVRARHHPRQLSAGTRLILASRTSLLLTARRATVEYDPDAIFRGVELARTLNSTTDTYDGALAIGLTPLTTLTVTATTESTRFALAPERDSTSFRIAPQVSVSPLGLLTGTASVGYRRLEGRDPSLPSYSGISAAGALGCVMADRYRLETTFARDVRSSYEAALPYYVQTAGRVSLATYLIRGIDVRLLGGREVMAYRPFLGGDQPGRDVVTTYGGGLGYRSAEGFQVAATAEFGKRVSARDVTREYSNNRIFATLAWGAPTR